MSITTDLAALTTSTNTLLTTVTTLQSGVSATIAAAVAVSTNASQIPLVVMATNMINTQVLYVKISK